MDPISDMLVRIKNAQAVRSEHVVIPFSKMKFRIATILKEAGYVADVERKKRKAKKAEIEFLSLALKYDQGDGAVHGIKIVSRPSRHMYIKAKDIKPVRSGYGMAMLSTSKGILTSSEARKAGLGGEVLFEIW